MEALRLGDYDEVQIIFKNGNIDRIETKKRYFDNFPRIVDLLQGVAFGDFVIKKDKNKIQFIEIKKKERVD